MGPAGGSLPRRHAPHGHTRRSCFPVCLRPADKFAAWQVNIDNLVDPDATVVTIDSANRPGSLIYVSGVGYWRARPPPLLRCPGMNGVAEDCVIVGCRRREFGNC